MTDKPWFPVGFFLKTLLVVAAIVATVLAGVNVWSHETLKEARSSSGYFKPRFWTAELVS